MYTLTLRILLSACLWALPCLPLAAQGADPARIVPADERTDVYLTTRRVWATSTCWTCCCGGACG